MKKNSRNIIAAFLISLLTFSIVYFQWFGSLELSLQDSVYQRINPADSSIKIVAIDEKTLGALGQFENWTREPYARLVETLNAGEHTPKVIAFDILMVSDKGEEDQLLAQACATYDNVVMAQNLVFSTKLETNGDQVNVNSMHLDMVELPFAAVRDHVRTGYANTVQDARDSKIRYTIPAVGEYQSFASVIAEMAGAQKVSDGFFIDYTGGTETYETLSMIDVLEGKIPAAVFRDSIVLVGAHAAGMGDAYDVPAENGSRMYGVEIHANIIQNILEGRSLVYADRLWNAVLCALLIFGLTLSAVRMKLWLNALLTVLLIAGEFGLSLVLDSRGLVINMIAFPLGILCVFVWSVISKYAAEALQKRKIMNAFQKYVAPQVVEEISKNQDYVLTLGGEKRHIAVLFVDIRGFTPMSEALEPEQVVEILNEYLSLVTDAIFKNGGTLDKFIGDAAMAVFNAPFDSEDYIYKAACAARDIAAGGDRIAEKFMKRFGRTVSYGIGVNCGNAVVGNIGSDFRMDYTAIGDTVNTAARLESNAKPGQILISEYVYEQIRDRVEVTGIGEIPLKGKSKGVMVYSLDQIKE